MPLSEHEQRVLEQIERSLYADDPKFAATVRGIDPRAQQHRRYIRAAIGVAFGVALMPVAFVLGYSQIAVGGFAVVLLALLYGISAWRHSRDRRGRTIVQAPGHRWVVRSRRLAAAQPAMPKRTIMQRFEDRWNRRRDQYGN